METCTTPTLSEAEASIVTWPLFGMRDPFDGEVIWITGGVVSFTGAGGAGTLTAIEVDPELPPASTAMTVRVWVPEVTEAEFHGIEKLLALVELTMLPSQYNET